MYNSPIWAFRYASVYYGELYIFIIYDLTIHALQYPIICYNEACICAEMATRRDEARRGELNVRRVKLVPNSPRLVDWTPRLTLPGGWRGEVSYLMS